MISPCEAAPPGFETADSTSPMVAKSVSLAHTMSVEPVGSGVMATLPVNPPGFVGESRPSCPIAWFTICVSDHGSVPVGRSTSRSFVGSGGICTCTCEARAASRSVARCEPTTTSELLASSTAITTPSSSGCAPTTALAIAAIHAGASRRASCSGIIPCGGAG